MQALAEEVCLSAGGILYIEILCVGENTYYPAEIAPDTALYTRVRKRSKEGTKYVHKFTFSLVNGRQDLENWLDYYAEKFFLISITDYQNQTFVMGNADYPAELEEEYSTGRKAEDSNEYQFNFQCDVPI